MGGQARARGEPGRSPHLKTCQPTLVSTNESRIAAKTLTRFKDFCAAFQPDLESPVLRVEASHDMQLFSTTLPNLPHNSAKTTLWTEDWDLLVPEARASMSGQWVDLLLEVKEAIEICEKECSETGDGTIPTACKYFHGCIDNTNAPQVANVNHSDPCWTRSTSTLRRIASDTRPGRLVSRSRVHADGRTDWTRRRTEWTRYGVRACARACLGGVSNWLCLNPCDAAKPNSTREVSGQGEVRIVRERSHARKIRIAKKKGADRGGGFRYENGLYCDTGRHCKEAPHREKSWRERSRKVSHCETRFLCEEAPTVRKGHPVQVQEEALTRMRAWAADAERQRRRARRQARCKGIR